ncbi:LysR family transcriptional regulator [Paenibacillus daejeonensis]|uniref:LysR family transcriptional regulator n=1 Tax=Paenibacillus daejeonensis TaxID=135193 RepID=UPI000382EABE|nr:LysR family transcriptional regulator [Paenibacillus daejeonensis]
MNYNLLFYFKVLGETEHFGRASQILHIEQPSLSQSIKRLEKELGVALFEKRGRNVTLTEHGRAYHQQISKAFEAIDSATLELYRNAKLETITISSVHSHPKSRFSSYVTQFLGLPGNEHIKISIFERHTQQSFEALRNQACDLIVCSSKNEADDLVYIPVSRNRVLLIVPLDHPLAVHDEIDIREALSYKFIYPFPITGMRTIFEKLFAELGTLPPIALEAESVNFTASLVADNVGIALSPDSEHLQMYDIKKINLTNEASTFYHYLAYPRNKSLSPAAKQFVSFITAETAGRPDAREDV